MIQGEVVGQNNDKVLHGGGGLKKCQSASEALVERPHR